MKIIYHSRNIRQSVEEENREADLARALARLDFLCLLGGVPVDTEEQEEMTHE